MGYAINCVLVIHPETKATIGPTGFLASPLPTFFCSNNRLLSYLWAVAFTNYTSTLLAVISSCLRIYTVIRPQKHHASSDRRRKTRRYPHFAPTSSKSRNSLS